MSVTPLPLVICDSQLASYHRACIRSDVTHRCEFLIICLTLKCFLNFYVLNTFDFIINIFLYIMIKILCYSINQIHRLIILFTNFKILKGTCKTFIIKRADHTGLKLLPWMIWLSSAYFSNSYHLPLHLLNSSQTAIFSLSPASQVILVTRPLQLLFPLLVMLFPQISAWLTSFFI